MVLIRLAILGVAALGCLSAQTTQGLISGSILNSVTGRPVSGASVTFNSATLSASGMLQSDSAGYYFLPLLSTGTYSIRAIADGYQSQELQQLELPVAGRIQVDFRLRPLNDVWEAGQFRSVFLPGSKTIVTFYGPDVDTSRSGSFEGQQGKRGTLDTSVSYVIDPTQIGDLPLQGRDVYTMLVSLPGVTANNGTARGLGISVAGQRPSASNFLLDGVENNNYLITGPLSSVAPEAVQEYRISTNNYSAEYGRTSGFVANAVTRAGGNEFRGVGYEYLKNDVLNAADFADNLGGFGRRRQRENQFGYQAGGPILRNRLFFSSAFEQLISHSLTDPQTYLVPSTNFIPALDLPANRLSRQLLEKYPAPVVDSKQLRAPYSVAQPVIVDRTIALERGDYSFNGGRDRLMGRIALTRVTEPDFIWTAYKDFISQLYQHTTSGAGNWMHTWTPRLTSELKVSYSDDNLWWNRPHPEIPTLASADGTVLPGSPAFYEYRNHNRSLESIYSMVWTRNRHIISAGAGLLFRFNDGYLTAGRDSEYLFSDITFFGLDRPQQFRVTTDSLTPQPTQPDYNRSYYYPQAYAFLQDSFRLSSRFTLNYGLRYENFGAPKNTGAAKDALVELGPGGDFNARLASSELVRPAGGDQQVYGSDNNSWAGRFGFSWDPLGKSKTVIRGGYGMFYDRPFDNLWQNARNNGTQLAEYTLSGAINYLQPVASVLTSFANRPFRSNFPGETLIDPGLRNGYAQTVFVAVQQSVGESLTFEVDGNRSIGRRLITTDLVNRDFTTLSGRENALYQDVAWRSGQGKSSYSALTAVARYRLRTLQFQAAYTWSHSIDNQSDPLTGDFFNLDFTKIGTGTSTGLVSSFAEQFNSNGDRGNSDFDQRQNLFLLGVWQSDARRLLTRGWQISWMAAFRSGVPYTVQSATLLQVPVSGAGFVENQRANLINPAAAVFSNPRPATGGVYLLNVDAFAQPSNPSVLGNSGRNAFQGPGLYNLDLSLARSFGVPRMREGTRLTIRADAFNILNHANLNNPTAVLGSPGFGLATYGRQGTASGFPAVSPVNETARQIQMMVRVEF
jgi:hypothetical protein